MGYIDNLDFVNPTRLINSALNLIHGSTKKHIVKATQTESYQTNMIKFSRSALMRFTGLSGALAVAMGAYGTHVFYRDQQVPSELKDVYRTANYYHFLHSIALLAVPLTKRPLLVGVLMAAGMTIFCGTCYTYALTGHKHIGKLAPYGGTLLIMAWLSIMF